MARGKKEKLSLEELIEQAVVKEEEQPYKVPSNWVWTKFNKILDVRDGTHDTPKYIDQGIPLVTSKNLIQGNISFENVKYISEEEHKKISERSSVEEDDILMAMIGTIGNATLVKAVQPFSIKNVALFKPIDRDYISQQYICYYLHSAEQNMRTTASGGLQPFVSLTYLRNYSVPLPPLAEQQRIVDRIESLFEKLDTAKELAQNALDSFENRKAAILHKAFTGELTAKWREENGVSLDSWEEKRLKEVCSLITDGTHQTPQYAESGYVFLSSKNVTTGKIDWDNVKYIPAELHEKLYTRLAPKLNDILLAKNGTTGIAAIVDRECVFDIYVSLALLRPTEMVIPKYLLYAINNPITKVKFHGQLTGIGVPNLHLRNIRDTSIPIPTLHEQEYIIKVLDKLMEDEQQAQELCNVIEKIDLMKKSILARAFRGELGTNDPEEESAIELLKEVLKEKL